MADNMRFWAVVPAAGESRRMGRFKPLLPLGESTVIETAVACALTAADKAVVTVGKRSGELAAVLRDSFGEQVIIVENPDYAVTDMLTSVKLGLSVVADCDAFFILPADMPLVSADTFRALAAGFREGDEVLIPTFNGRQGHPVLAAAVLIPGILDYSSDTGLKGFFNSRRVRRTDVADTGILTDLDTPQDYERTMTEIMKGR